MTAAEMQLSIAQARSAQEQAVQVNYFIFLCCLAYSSPNKLQHLRFYTQFRTGSYALLRYSSTGLLNNTCSTHQLHTSLARSCGHQMFKRSPPANATFHAGCESCWSEDCSVGDSQCRAQSCKQAAQTAGSTVSLCLLVIYTSLLFKLSLMFHGQPAALVMTKLAKQTVRPDSRICCLMQPTISSSAHLIAVS